MDLDLETLRLLENINRTGSLRRAAESAGVTQQAVSARIQLAERRLGRALVHRSRSGSELTDDGKLVIEWARPLLEAADIFAASVRTLRSKADICVAASQSISEQLLPGWMDALRQAPDAPTVRLISGSSADVIKRVRGHVATLGFIEAPEVPTDLASQRIRSDPLAVVVSPDHPWAGQGRVIPPAELPRTPLICDDKGSGRCTLELALHAAEVDGSLAPPAAIMTGTGAIAGAAASGIAPAVVSRSLVRPHLDSGALVEVEIEGIQLYRPFTMVWTGQPARTSAAHKFLSIITSRTDAGTTRTNRHTGGFVNLSG
ncbi:LysR family transcriptional regulator [Arthrobacter crystallopoietes]|uniref:LysR family transcriptional regulator n=1 Tax=Crystallibacter crystallopoietes TaxID=37928 RepID=UPI0023EF4EB7|nr:LysR substrate-binding domain-containing protein [Arthrobacter crystallopoietes]